MIELVSAIVLFFFMGLAWTETAILKRTNKLWREAVEIRDEEIKAAEELIVELRRAIKIREETNKVLTEGIQIRDAIIKGNRAQRFVMDYHQSYN